MVKKLTVSQLETKLGSFHVAGCSQPLSQSSLPDLSYNPKNSVHILTPIFLTLISVLSFHVSLIPQAVSALRILQL
jgi:hypothetical protein